MHPIETFVRNPVKVWVGTLLLCLFGVIAWQRMPMQLTPEVQVPTITITTMWPGASPQDVEREIVQEQEEQLKGVQGVVKTSSECADSVAKVTLEFKVGTDMQEALLLVNSRLQQVPEYPEDADEPVITSAGAADSPIAWFVLTARLPEREVFDKFVKEHPQHKAAVERILKTTNSGIAEQLARRLAAADDAAKVLLPKPLDLPQWRKFTENTIEANFERVPGVSNSNVVGGLDPELKVIVDPEKLAARQVTIAQLRNALRSQNIDTSAGDVQEGKIRWVVRTLNQFRSPEQVENQVLAVHDGAPIYVRDVAQIKESFKKANGFVRRFGNQCIAVNVVRETGANVLNVMEGLRQATDQLNAGILKDRGLLLTQVYDETEYIDDALALVRENIFSGSALTMICLMVCLHLNRKTFFFSPLILATSLLSVAVSPWFFAICVGLIFLSGFWFARGALVIGLTIPVCLIGTFLCLDLLGMSLNVISLAGLAFAVGIVVDNATVVMENIYRHYQMGRSPEAAATEATKEVWGAVLASTATNLSVFLPVLLVQDEAGQLFRDISLAIAGSTALSLVIAVTLIPVVSAKLLQSGADLGDFGEETPGAKPARGLVHALEHFGAAFINRTVKLNAWIQETVTRRVVVSVVMTVVSIALSFWFRPQLEYLPNGNRNLIIGIVIPPPGYNLDEFNRLSDIVEDELRPYWDNEPGSKEEAELNFPPLDDFFVVVHERQFFVGLVARKKTEARKLIPMVMSMTPKMPGSFAFAIQLSLFARDLKDGRAIDVEISGPNLDQLRDYGGQIMGQIGDVLEPNVDPAQRATQARPIPSLDPGSPELRVVPRSLQAEDMKLRADEIGYAVNALVDGAYASDYYVGRSSATDPDNPYAHIGGDKIDLSIVGLETAAARTHDVESLPIATPEGKLVPLSALADVTMGVAPEQINRRERERTITIQVTPPPAMALETAIERIQSQIVEPMKRDGRLKPGDKIILGGAVDKLTEAWNALGGNVVLATLITYLLMAALFESWSYPFVIILSVPLGAVGGILGLQFLNYYLILLGDVPQALDVLTMLGFVILIGTVVNNPILIVHQSLNHMRVDRMPPLEAVLESVRNRIRPIFITTLTTVIGLIPLVLFPGAGSELYRGLGAVVLGGITVSTIFTLVLIPAMFTLMLDLQKWMGFKLPVGNNEPTVERRDPSANGNGADHTEEPVAAQLN